MAKTIKLNELGFELQKLVSKYGKDIENSVVEELNKSAEELKDLSNDRAPKSARNSSLHLAGSFEVKQVTKKGQKEFIVWSPTDYPLVHLVEFGHMHYKTGHFVQPQPFFIPSYTEVKERLYINLKNIIEKGGKE